MPNELINTKGDYKVTKRSRRIDQRKEELLNYQSRRIYITQPEFSLLNFVKLIGLYLILYVLCAIVLACNLQIVYKYRVPANEPLVLKSTSLSSVPGNFVGDRKMIRYQADQKHQITPYVEQIDNFVEKYGIHGIRHLRGCNLDNNWGYNTGLPCVLLKLNYAINFTAETYMSSIALPKEAPDDLADYLVELPLEDRLNRIWMSCTFLDNTTNAKVDYVPNRFYDAEGLFEKEHIFFRSVSENLRSNSTYENPAFRRVIGARFKNIPMNQDVPVKCTAWAKNIPSKLASTIIVFRIEGHEVFPNPDPDYYDE